MADCILPFLKSKINTNQFDFALFLDDIERNETGAWLIPNGKTQAWENAGGCIQMVCWHIL